VVGGITEWHHPNQSIVVLVVANTHPTPTASVASTAMIDFFSFFLLQIGVLHPPSFFQHIVYHFPDDRWLTRMFRNCHRNHFTLIRNPLHHPDTKIPLRTSSFPSFSPNLHSTSTLSLLL
jgi:hypothetical protein